MPAFSPPLSAAAEVRNFKTRFTNILLVYCLHLPYNDTVISALPRCTRRDGRGPGALLINNDALYLARRNGSGRKKVNKKQDKVNVHWLTEVALLVAIELVMKVTGLSSIPVGPLVMTFNMVPIAVGAMLSGPLAGAILGLVYGFTSFYDAMSGASVMTGIFFQISPLLTFVLCVVVRVLVGFLTGLLFRAVSRVDRTRTVRYFIGGLAAPLLNTILFMGFIVLVFYDSEYIQGLVSTLGASGPLMFVVLAVGVQGAIEAAVGMLLGGGVTKAVAKALKRD